MQKAYINLEQVIEKILPITELRRNPGGVFRRLPEVKGFIITKGGKPVGKLYPMENKSGSSTIQENLKKLKAVVGGFDLKISLSPRQINEIIDRSYEEMLS